MMNTYTHYDLKRDRNDRSHDGHYGYNVDLDKYSFDLDHFAGGPGLKDFYLIIAWCIDNCSNKWFIDWNSETVIFEAMHDAMAFKLTWL